MLRRWLIIVLTKQYKLADMDIFDQYVTVIEAAKRLGIHPETVKRLCRQGDIPGTVKIRNTWLIEKEKLEVFAGIYQPKRGGKRRLL